MALRCDTVENHKSRGCEITSAINPESKQLNIQVCQPDMFHLKTVWIVFLPL